MSCDNVRDRISLLLDHRTVGGERETMLAHLAGCEACGARYESLRDMKRVMGRMSRTPVPPDVQAKLRALAARERARQLSRLSHGSRLSYWAGRLRMEFENLMRPMALPFAGGVCAALLAFGMLVPNLSFAHHLYRDDPAVSLPTNPDGKVVGVIGEIPRVESIDASQAESATSDGTVVFPYIQSRNQRSRHRLCLRYGKGCESIIPRFTDPNNNETRVFSSPNYEIEVPVYTTKNMDAVISSLKNNTRDYYRYKSGTDVLRAINKANRRWSTLNYDLRSEALEILPNIVGSSRENIEVFGFNPMAEFDTNVFDANSFEKLNELVKSGDYKKFTPFGDGYVKGYGIPELQNFKKPDLITQILPGNVVGLPWLTVSLGVASQCGQVLKTPSNDKISIFYYLDSIEDVDPDLRKTISAGFWSSGDNVENKIFSNSDIVTVMGSDETVETIGNKVKINNPNARVLSHPHKRGFHVIGREYANSKVSELIAWGATSMDTNACYSCPDVFVESGGDLSPQEFAEAVSGKMKDLANLIPPNRSLDIATKVRDFRNQQKQRAVMMGENVKIISGRNSDYTVIYDEANSNLSLACGNRAVYIKPIESIDKVPMYVKPTCGHLQTIGIASSFDSNDEFIEYADSLGEVGVTNIHVPGAEYVVKSLEPHDGIFDARFLFVEDKLRWCAVNFTDMAKEIENALERKRRVLTSLS